jgi:hypothetical protein
MFLVLNLSFNSSQKNTLCLHWQEVFQSHLKAGWIVPCPIKTLDVFEEENVLDPQMNVIKEFLRASCCVRRKETFETGMLKNSEKEAEFLALATDKSVRFANEWSPGYCNQWPRSPKVLNSSHAIALPINTFPLLAARFGGVDSP